MIKDAEAHADEAHKLREIADAKNHAEALVYATEKSLKEHRESLDEADASTIEGRVMELKQALEGDDVSDIKSKTDSLQEALAQAGRGGLRQGERGAGGRRRQRRVRGGPGRRGDRGRRGRRRGGSDLVTEPQTTRRRDRHRQRAGVCP